MTDHTAAPDPSPSSGGRWRIPVLVAALVLVIVVVVALATRGGDDDGTDPAADPTSTSTPTAPTSSSAATDSPSAGDSPTANDDPIPSPIVNKAVKAAIRDGFPALVPSGVPVGWTVVSASYHPSGGGVWQIELTDPAGNPVSLRQSTATIEVQLAQVPDVQPAGNVNLSDYGTGTWKAYAGTGIAVLAKKLSDTSAIVIGPDQDTAVTLAQELLTAEDAGVTTDD